MNQREELLSKLWVYTNYNCNLSCSYCCANSTPHTPAQAVSLDTARNIIDEAQEIEFRELFLTGGEPFILDNIFDILAYATQRLKTTVLTNAMLFKGRRLERLAAIGPHNLTMQASNELFPLSQALDYIKEELEVIAAGGVPQNKFT